MLVQSGALKTSKGKILAQIKHFRIVSFLLIYLTIIPGTIVFWKSLIYVISKVLESLAYLE